MLPETHRAKMPRRSLEDSIKAPVQLRLSHALSLPWTWQSWCQKGLSLPHSAVKSRFFMRFYRINYPTMCEPHLRPNMHTTKLLQTTFRKNASRTPGKPNLLPSSCGLSVGHVANGAHLSEYGQHRWSRNRSACGENKPYARALTLSIGGGGGGDGGGGWSGGGGAYHYYYHYHYDLMTWWSDEMWLNVMECDGMRNGWNAMNPKGLAPRQQVGRPTQPITRQQMPKTHSSLLVC